MIKRIMNGFKECARFMYPLMLFGWINCLQFCKKFDENWQVVGIDWDSGLHAFLFCMGIATAWCILTGLSIDTKEN